MRSNRTVFPNRLEAVSTNPRIARAPVKSTTGAIAIGINARDGVSAKTSRETRTGACARETTRCRTISRSD